ncbi:hypothetical protein TNCV_2552501 [Trichonephila clavipes]|nr:hypothetical protein TNCV_2552501 [Trichonephila clavipes]
MYLAHQKKKLLSIPDLEESYATYMHYACTNTHVFSGIRTQALSHSSHCLNQYKGRKFKPLSSDEAGTPDLEPHSPNVHKRTLGL